MKLNFKKSSAFTLVELLLVVGIIALGSVVAYITLPKVQSTARANAEATSINTLSAGIKNVYAGTNVFNGLDNGVLINAKAAPDKMIDPDNAGVLLNGFGSPVTVQPGTLSGANFTANATPANAYRITYEAVPPSECNKLATGVGNNFTQVLVGTDVVKQNGASTVDVTAVSTACNASEENTMYFIGK